MKFNSPEALERFKQVIDFDDGNAAVCIRGKTRISIEVIGNKVWVMVRFNNSQIEWLPSFEDLYYIIRGLARCEDIAYRDPHYAGRGKVSDFLNDIIWGEGSYTYEELAEKYRLPHKKEPAFIPINSNSKKK